MGWTTLLVPTTQGFGIAVSIATALSLRTDFGGLGSIGVWGRGWTGGTNQHKALMAWTEPGVSIWPENQPAAVSLGNVLLSTTLATFMQAQGTSRLIAPDLPHLLPVYPANESTVKPRPPTSHPGSLAGFSSAS